MATFAVTAAQATLALNADGHGRASFSATCASGLRARALVVPAGAAQAGWFSIAGEAQRLFQPAVAEAFDVDVEVPREAGGDLRLRLDVVGVDNPDEDYGRGPEVTLKMTAAPPPPAASRGYLVTFVGALVGAVAGALVGTLPATIALFAILHAPVRAATSIGDLFGQVIGSGVALLIGFFLLLLGVAIGLWLGPVLGAYVALRIRSHRRAGVTAVALLGIQLVWMVAVFAAVAAISDAIKNSSAVPWLLAAVVVLAVCVPPWLARGLVRLVGDHHV
jgi:hypothetical protein